MLSERSQQAHPVLEETPKPVFQLFTKPQMLAERSQWKHPVLRLRVRKVPQQDSAALCPSDDLEACSKYLSWTAVITSLQRRSDHWPTFLQLQQ